MSRAKRILQLSMKNNQHELEETRNPESAIFVQKQFSKPYDDLVVHDNLALKSASSDLLSDNFIDCIENKDPYVEDPHVQHTNNVSQIYEIVDNVIIEEVFQFENEQYANPNMPSLISPRYVSPLIENNFDTFGLINLPSSSNDLSLHDDLIIAN